MNIDWMSPELKELIEMALTTHAEFCPGGRFWDCPMCTEERESLIRSISMEAKIYAAKVRV